MPTGDEFVKLAMKRFISENRLDENFLEYLQETFHDGLSRIFPASGLFTYPVTITPSVSPDVFDLSPDPIEGIDNAGHVFVIGTSLLNDIPFENVTSATYWIGFKYIEIVSDVYTNPRTGEIEYDKIVETAGEKADPDVGKILDLTGTIQLTVDTLFTNGVDHSGRVVKVYLKNPMSGDAATAIEECTVTYDGGSGENRITTTGTLGQSTVSTTSTDYTVVCEGCTIRKGVTNPLGDEYMMIGNIVGDPATPTTNTTGYQLDLSGGGGHSIQSAYDGASGSGSGKNANVNDGAIHLTQETDAVYGTDIFHAALRLTKDADKSAFSSGNIKEMERAIDVKTRFYSKGAFIHRANLQDLSGNGFLSAQEAISIDAAGNRIRFTRVGTDLTFTGVNAEIQVGPIYDVVEITGSTLGNDGVYVIVTVVDADEIDVFDIAGSAASLVQETSNPALKASIYREVVIIGDGYDQIKIHPLSDFQNDIPTITGGALEIEVPDNSNDTASVVRIRRGSTTFTIKNTIDVETQGRLVTSFTDVSDPAIEATAGDIQATAGDIEADGAITAIDGNITAVNGIIQTATGGNIVSTGDFNGSGDVDVEGNVEAVGNVISELGYVDAVIGDVTAGDDVIADQDVIATNGDIDALAGSVHAGNNVNSDGNVFADFNGGGSGDFGYGLAKICYKSIFGADWNDTTQSATVETEWANLGGYWIIDAATGDTYMIAPVHLPDGAVVKELSFKHKATNHATAPMTCSLNRIKHEVDSPSTDVTIDTMATCTSTGTAINVVTDATISNATIDNELYAYYLRAYVTSVSGAADRLYGARIKYEVLTVTMG